MKRGFRGSPLTRGTCITKCVSGKFPLEFGQGKYGVELSTIKEVDIVFAIDVNSEQLQEVEINGHYGIFTELRVNKHTIPKGVNCYELRHGDDDSYPVTVEENVRGNYFGAVLMIDKMELGQVGYIEISYDDFGFTGDELTMLEYQANYLDEPVLFSSGADFAKFMGICKTPFELTETEADKILGYMEGHDFLVGEKDGKLFRGDLCYQQGKVRWAEDSIDDVINDVSEWNYDLLQKAQIEMENPNDFIDFVNKKARVEMLEEDYQILDALFDRTKYGVEIQEIAERLVGELLEDLQSKGSLEGAIQKMTEAIAEGKDLLPEVSPELKQITGKVR